MQFVDFFLIWTNLTSNIQNWEKLIKLQNYQRLRINFKKNQRLKIDISQIIAKIKGHLTTMYIM